MFFRADGEPRVAALNDERRELLAIDLGEDNKHIGKRCIRNPHLLAVQDIMLTVRRKHSLGAAIQRIRSRRRLRKRVRTHQFTGSQPRHVLLLLFFRSEIDDGQGADARVSQEAHGEAPGLGDAVGNNRRRHLVHLHAAVLFRHVDRADAQFAGLLDQLAGERKIFVLDLVDVRDDLVIREIFRRLRNELMLLVEVFGSKHFLDRCLVEQEAPAYDFAFGNACRRHALSKILSPQRHRENKFQI